MKRNANKVLESIRQSLAQHLPSGGRAVLFGSQATSLRFIKTLNKKELYWYEFK